MDNISTYEYSLEIFRKSLQVSPKSDGPKFIDFLPLVVFAGLVLVVLIVYTGFKVSKMLEKNPEDDPPPSYDGLDVVVPPPGPDFVHTNPPSYEVAVEGEMPPPYGVVNSAFVPDPPAYTAVTIISTQETTVFNTQM